MRKIALLIVLALVPMIAQPATAAAAAGSGEASFPGCPPGTDKLALAGADNDGTWTFVVLDANTYQFFGQSCIVTGAEVYSGAWDPAVGGCLAGSLGGELCLTNPAGTAASRRYTLLLSILIAAENAIPGTATLNFA